MENKKLSDNLYFGCFLVPPFYIPEIPIKEKKYHDFVKPVLERDNGNTFIIITNDLFLKIDVLNLHDDIESYLEKDMSMVRIDEGRFDISSICIDYINILQLFIMSEYIGNKHFGAFFMNEATRNKLIWCRTNSSEYENIDLNCDPYSNILSDARHGFLYMNKYSCNRISYEFNNCYNLEYFLSAIDKYLKVIDNDIIRNSLSHLTNCLFLYYKGNFADSFILVWFYIESYYRKIRENKKGKSSERKTIYNLIEYLHNEGDINDKEYSDLTTLREHRNSLAHNYQETKGRDKTSQGITLLSIHFCLWLINGEFNLDIMFDPNVKLLNYSTSMPL